MPLTPYVGQIMPAAFGIIPTGWALCNGALLPIGSNQALFSLLGTIYGGDGIKMFGLPDLRGRAVLGSNFASVPWGQVSGSEKVQVTTAQLPAHNHVIQASAQAGPAGKPPSPAGHIFGQNTVGPPVQLMYGLAGSMEVGLSVGTNVVNAGGDQPHNNMQPSLVINYLIALQGIFPSRS